MYLSRFRVCLSGIYVYLWVHFVWLVDVLLSGFGRCLVLLLCLILLPPLHMNAQANQSRDGCDQSAEHDWDSKMM